MSSELSSFPPPEIHHDSGKLVKSWHCACGRELGEFSARRTWEVHGMIVCGECWVKEHPIEKEEQYANISNL